MKKTVYCLRLKKDKKLLTSYAETGGEGSTFYVLGDFGDDPVWQLESKEAVEWVRQNSTPYYNAQYDTPKHQYKSEELEVIEREIIICDEPIEVKIPTQEEFVTWQHLTKGERFYNKVHGESLLGLIAKGEYRYDSFDLQQWLEDHK